jgi:hypothetical protein
MLKKTAGRPVKYTKEFIENEAIEFKKWMQNPKNVFFESFAIERGYSCRLLSIWAKENEIFSEVLDYAHDWQKCKLLNGGLLSTYNSNIVKLILSNTIGWSDKQQVSGDVGNPLKFIIDSIDGKTKDLVSDEE